jgi:hypothetical protein
VIERKVLAPRHTHSSTHKIERVRERERERERDRERERERGSVRKIAYRAGA